MFANIAIAFLVSLGVALVIFVVAKLCFARFQAQILHVLVAALVVVGSTVAGTVAITGKNVSGYIASVEKQAQGLTERVDAVQNQYGLDRFGISVSDIAKGTAGEAVSKAKGRIKTAQVLSLAVIVSLNVLLLAFFVHSGRKAGSYKRKYDSDEDNLDDFDGASSFDDLDLD